jgi:hypothetical protein
MRGIDTATAARPEKSSALKIVSILTENKQVTARNDQDPIFMPGSVLAAHEVISEDTSGSNFVISD